MTEEEAKTKVCPIGRISLTVYREPKHGEPETGIAWEHNCIGSACMMFRHDYRVTDTITGEVGKSWGVYCGLAGKP
jgi:hypothetical protein